MRSKSQESRKFAMLFGIGLDGKDGHIRQTRGEEFFLVGGSEKTHEAMQDRAQAISEELQRRGKRLVDVSGPEELRDIVHDAGI